jgi:hypothetical protein
MEVSIIIYGEGGMERKDLASKCWDGANGVTAFACAQMVAFLLSLLSDEVQKTVGRPFDYACILTSVLVFWTLYTVCILIITNAGLLLLEKPDDLVKKVWKQALWGRLGIVSLFSALSFGSLLVLKM